MGRNVVKEYVEYDKSSMKEYIDMITNSKMDEKLIDVILNTYIDVRYYDAYPHETDSPLENLNYFIKKNTEEFIEENYENISENKFNKTISDSLWLIKYMMQFEKNSKKVELLDKLKQSVKTRFKNENLDTDLLFEKIENCANNKKEFLKKCECLDFSMIEKTTNVQNVFYTDLKSNIVMPDLFSELAIKRVWNSGTTSEEKMLVWYTLCSLKILNDIVNFNYKNNYIVGFNINLNKKKLKGNALMEILDLDLLKEKIHFAITYDEYKENQSKIEKWISQGFKFAIIIDKNYNEAYRLLDIFSYIIIEGSAKDFKELHKQNNVIYKDLLGV